MDLLPVRCHLAQPFFRKPIWQWPCEETSWQASFLKYWVSLLNVHTRLLSIHFSFNLFFLFQFCINTQNSLDRVKKKFHFVPSNLCRRFFAACLMETFCLSDLCVQPTASLWRDDASVIAYQKKSRPDCQPPRSTSACLMAFSVNEWISTLPWQDINTDTSSILMLCELPWFLSASLFHISAGDTSGDSGGDTAEIPNSIQGAQGSSIIHTRCRTDWIVTSRASADGEDWRGMSGSPCTPGLESSPPSWGRVHFGNNVTNLRLTLLRPRHHPSKCTRLSQPHPVRRLAKTQPVFLVFFFYDSSCWMCSSHVRGYQKLPLETIRGSRGQDVKDRRFVWALGDESSRKKKISNLSFCGWEEKVV